MLLNVTTLRTLELRPILPAVTSLALLALLLAFPAVTPQHTPTNVNAPRELRASAGWPAANISPAAGISRVV